MGIKSELNKSVKIVSLISKNELEIKNSIDNSSPQIVMVSSVDMIKVWKKLQSKYPELNQIASILLESEFTENDLGGFSNGCVINSDITLGQYITSVNQLTGKKPQNIGIIYSSKSAKIAQAYQTESAKLNVTVYTRQVIASDPEASIKSAVKNLKDVYNVDYIIVLDDPVTINNQNVNTTWVSLLAGLSIPVAVPAEHFNEIEPRIGSLAIQQHYSAIGGVIASVINNAENNNWYINQKYIYTDKSIFYFRNSDGSISKQNYVQNDIVALYHPPKVMAPVQPEPYVEKQPVALPSNIAIASEESVSYNNTDLSNEPEIPMQKTVQAKPAVIGGKQDQFKGKKEISPVVKDVAKGTSAEVARTNANEVSDEVFSPANSAPEQDMEITRAFQNDIDSTPLPPQKYQSNQFQNAIIIILIALIVGAIVVYILLKRRNDKKKNKCLLITDSKTQIKYSELTNKSIRLSKYLKNCGFDTIVTKYLDQINDLLLFNLPEAICVDWQLDSDIQVKFYKILKEQNFSGDFILIFYNVPDSAKTIIGYFEDRTFYLGTDFIIPDLNKILSIVKKRTHATKQSDDKVNPQLEGKIVGDSLSEIFQMMDINKKTGCLIVETDHPTGTIFFEDGFITYAISNTQIAEQAVFEVLALKSGTFLFVPEKKPLSRNMQASVVAILMAQAQSTDESTELDLLQ